MPVVFPELVSGCHCIQSSHVQVLWYESGQLRDYTVFAAGAALTFAWFLHHHFWFLEVGTPCLRLCLGT